MAPPRLLRTPHVLSRVGGHRVPSSEKGLFPPFVRLLIGSGFMSSALSLLSSTHSGHRSWRGVAAEGLLGSGALQLSTVSFVGQELFNLIPSHLSIVGFISWIFRVLLRNLVPVPRCWSVEAASFLQRVQKFLFSYTILSWSLALWLMPKMFSEKFKADIMMIKTNEHKCFDS